MKNTMKRFAALGLVGVTAASTVLTGCGGKKSSGGDDLTFSWTLPTPDTSFKIKSWDESAAVQEWLQDDGTDVKYKWNMAPTTADADFYTTMISTGEYTDIMVGNTLPETVTQLYSDGVSMDITDYVEKDMPNYMAWIKAHPEYKDQIYKKIDGEKKMVCLYNVNDASGEPWSAFIYRRDWIVKYGKNPQTGAAFTGGYTDDAKTEWKDDVVFPSGEAYPKTISDWDWMLGIFREALKGEGITDGYPMQMSYHGFYAGQGSLFTSFGGTFPGHQITRDGNVEFGWTDSSDAARAYTQCMADWYKKGYIDQAFDTRASDSIFFMIDQAHAYAGKVGLMYNLTSMLGHAMAEGKDGDPILENVCFEVAPQPINDTYGPDSVKNVEPWHYFESGSQLGGTIVITEAAKDKDLDSLFKSLDYLYSDEGAALCSYGVSDEQQAKLKNKQMTALKLDDGAYKKSEKDGKTVYDINQTVITKDLNAAVTLNRMSCGRFLNNTDKVVIDKHYSQFKNDQLALAVLYQGGGEIKYTKEQLSPDDQTALTTAANAAGDYIDANYPKFITGAVELNDANWDKFQKDLKDFGLDTYTEKMQKILK